MGGSGGVDLRGWLSPRPWSLRLCQCLVCGPSKKPGPMGETGAGGVWGGLGGLGGFWGFDFGMYVSSCFTWFLGDGPQMSRNW